MKPFKCKRNCSYCGAINCSNSKVKQPHLSFHRFPRDPVMSKKWVQNTRRADLINASPEYLYDNITICSEHFNPEDYYSGGSSKLRRDAVPTKFDVPNLPKSATPRRPLIRQQETVTRPAKKARQPEMDWGGINIIFGNAEDDNAPSTSGGTSGVHETGGKENVDTDTVRSDSQTASSGMTSRCDEKSPVGVEESRGSKIENKLRCKVYRQQKKIQKLEAELQEKRETTMNEVLSYTKQVLPPNVYSFLKLQLKCAGVKPKGRRYSDNDMMMALALHYQGARAYRHMRSIFYLPHPRQLRKRIEHIQMLPGFQDVVVNLLGEKLKQMTDSDKLVVLSMDEMTVRKKLVYHRGEDYVEGFEDMGEMGRTARVADQALVLMARGVKQAWKQPIGFFYSAGPTPAAVLEELVKSAIRKLRKAGMGVVATVCDMGKPNQDLLKRLGVSVDCPHFSVDGEEVVAMYDVPHLFKCIRNALHKYDINHSGATASWQHVLRFYAEDIKGTVRTAPSLRRSHIKLEAFKKMKVKSAAKVMSRSVSAGIHLLCDFGRLPEECRGTADFLLRLNDIMDVLNSSRPTDPCRNKRAFAPATEEEHIRILESGRDWIRTWQVGEGAKIDSVEGLQLTVNAILRLWESLRGCLRFMCTRRFNQDCIENFFCTIRQMNGGNDQPNPSQFRHAFRKSSMNTMLKSQEGGNCEPDADALLAVVSSSSARSDRPMSTISIHCQQGGVSVPANADYVDGVTENVLAYIAGYLIHQEVHLCATCDSAMVSESRKVRRTHETLLGLKSYTGVSVRDMGSLKAPSEALHRLMVVAYNITETQARSAMLNRGVCRKLMLCVSDTPQYRTLHSCLCPENRLESMFARFVRMQLHLVCMKVTAESGKGANRANRKYMKLSSRVM